MYCAIRTNVVQITMRICVSDFFMPMWSIQNISITKKSEKCHIIWSTKVGKRYRETFEKLLARVIFCIEFKNHIKICFWAIFGFQKRKLKSYIPYLLRTLGVYLWDLIVSDKGDHKLVWYFASLVHLKSAICRCHFVRSVGFITTVPLTYIFIYSRRFFNRLESNFIILSTEVLLELGCVIGWMYNSSLTNGRISVGPHEPTNNYNSDGNIFQKYTF